MSEILGYFFAENSSYRFLKQPQDVRLKRKLTLTYSTVTDLARFLGWSISVPLKRATSYESI